ncbi:hypothetical protein ACKWTF_003619 [Chironomus riparius]
MLTQSNKMFNLVLILSVLLFKNGSCYEITSYARVSKNGGSISAKSDTANDPSSNYMSHIESTLIDKQNNVALKQQQLQEKEQQQQKTATSGNENVKEVEEKSEGRAIKSNYYFPLSDFLTKAKAMQSNSYKNEKEGRLIVYPSYTQNIDQTRRRYDMTPSTGQVAQRRFAPGEAYGVTGYKLKHPEKFPGYKYPQPNPVPQPQPQPIMMNSAPPRQPLPQPPMIMPTFNPPAASMMSDLPPSQHYLPPSGDMMMPPSGLMDMPSSGPPDDHEHDDHHHHHDHPWDSYPDIYYDDHDHHHHHHHVEETTTPAPLPVEPRVKKYSYYYLGRKLWYIPLYFTFWFCLYVAALIIRSIGRHKVDLPNHYVARSLHDMSHKEVVEKINKMTEFAMTQIDDFKNKYL